MKLPFKLERWHSSVVFMLGNAAFASFFLSRDASLSIVFGVLVCAGVWDIHRSYGEMLKRKANEERAKKFFNGGQGY